jgi:hypothetical protein
MLSVTLLNVVMLSVVAPIEVNIKQKCILEDHRKVYQGNNLKMTLALLKKHFVYLNRVAHNRIMFVFYKDALFHFTKSS